jgi:hypothetical protein
MATDGPVKRAGRPEKPAPERLYPVPMRLEAGIFDEVCRKAREAGVSAAAELRRLVKKAIALERDLRIH